MVNELDSESERYQDIMSTSKGQVYKEPDFVSLDDERIDDEPRPALTLQIDS